MSAAPIDHLDTSPSEAVRRHAATFRQARLARRDELSDQVEHRPPRVPAREAISDEVPRPAATVAKLAREHGWAVRLTYAEGPLSDEDASTSSVVLRARSSDARCAWAMWRSSAPRCPMKRKWTLAWCLLADGSDGLRKVGAADLKRYLAGELSDEKTPVVTRLSDDVEYETTNVLGGEEEP